MGHKALRFVLFLLVMVVIQCLAPRAEAGKMDLGLARFIDCTISTACTPDTVSYERFLAEYAFGLAPKMLAPANTLGYSGFYMGIESTLTTVPTSDQAGQDRWTKGLAPGEYYPNVMFMPAVHIRKGLPWSFELGGSINYLAQSELVGLGMDLKWALFEGYRHGFRGYLPALAARGSVMRVLGESDIDITVVGIDGSISYPFGLGGMVTLTPYFGVQYLLTLARIEPLVYRDDATAPPAYREPTQDDDDETALMKWDMTGLSGPNLSRMRLLFGFAFGYELLRFSFELGWGLPKDWDTTATANAMTLFPAQATHVGHQLNISFGIGTQF